MTPDTSLKQGKILIVDDEKTNVRFLEIILADNSRDLIALLNLQYPVLCATLSHLQVLGCTEAKWVSHSIFEVIHVG